MVFLNIKVYHGGWIGHVDGSMRYIGGHTMIVEDNDSDFWCVYEAEEQLARFGHAKEDKAAMWYKDPQVTEYEIGLMLFDSDRAALDMIDQPRRGREARQRKRAEAKLPCLELTKSKGAPTVKLLVIRGGAALGHLQVPNHKKELRLQQMQTQKTSPHQELQEWVGSLFLNLYHKLATVMETKLKHHHQHSPSDNQVGRPGRGRNGSATKKIQSDNQAQPNKKPNTRSTSKSASRPNPKPNKKPSSQPNKKSSTQPTQRTCKNTNSMVSSSQPIR
ncbi:hypothetical protein PIB30_027183 [Stylosanthes scabra]|uniref:PB1-like domain-containing protein n=1 Tax=Stylosanthes scabra TaxID=79078 RepID=A0ABU6RB07_9FABA|nr:hypothetical protein [Stylosanthes scabra]